MQALALPLAPAPHPPEPPTLVAWRAGLESIDPSAFHPPGMLIQPRYGQLSSGRSYSDPAPWPAVHAAMLAFLDAWGAQAAALGWSAEALFGVHRRACALRADSTGALVTLLPMRVEAIDGDTIALVRDGSRQTFRGLNNLAESVPIWAFGRA